MWVIAALASLAVLATLVLCVPLDISIHLDVYGRPKFRVRLTWLFGLVSKEVRGGRKKPEKKKRVVEVKRKLRERGRRARTIFEILRTKGLLRQLRGLLMDVLRRFKIGELKANCRVGLDTPADTGLLFAVIRPATLFLSSSRVDEIRVQPSFDAAVFEGYLHGAVRLHPIQLVLPFLRFAFSLAAIRVIKILVMTKWRRRK